MVQLWILLRFVFVTVVSARISLSFVTRTVSTTRQSRRRTTKGFSTNQWVRQQLQQQDPSHYKAASHRMVSTNRNYFGGDSPIRDLIDSEAAMRDFFTTREDWLPIFRSIAVDDASCLASGYLGTSGIAANKDDGVEFNESSSPWRRLNAIPSEDEDRKVLDSFLTSVHQSLLDIPVTEGEKDDENDLHFLEEGRRLLAINRFHVVRSGGETDSFAGPRATAPTSLQSYDHLFSMCWSEIMELTSQAQEHTGSLILLPGYQINDLHRFADMNLHRPLEWLGVSDDFEISSMQRGTSPIVALRFLYKLNDMPTDSASEAKLDS